MWGSAREAFATTRLGTAAAAGALELTTAEDAPARVRRRTATTCPRGKHVILMSPVVVLAVAIGVMLIPMLVDCSCHGYS